MLYHFYDISTQAITIYLSGKQIIRKRGPEIHEGNQGHVWKTEDVATVFNVFHATEGSNYLELTVTNLAFENFSLKEKLLTVSH
jgi:hypothetical protein